MKCAQSIDDEAMPGSGSVSVSGGKIQVIYD